MHADCYAFVICSNWSSHLKSAIFQSGLPDSWRGKIGLWLARWAISFVCFGSFLNCYILSLALWNWWPNILLALQDDMHVRVYNYNTLERVNQFEAHSDYLRSIAVHPTQPYILTSSGEFNCQKCSEKKIKIISVPQVLWTDESLVFTKV